MAREYENIRNVRMTDELVENWIVRTADGSRAVWDWGEPDADGFYTPTCWAMDDGKALVDRDSLAAALVEVDGAGRPPKYEGWADAILAALRG